MSYHQEIVLNPKYQRGGSVSGGTNMEAVSESGVVNVSRAAADIRGQYFKAIGTAVGYRLRQLAGRVPVVNLGFWTMPKTVDYEDADDLKPVGFGEVQVAKFETGQSTRALKLGAPIVEGDQQLYADLSTGSQLVVKDETVYLNRGRESRPLGPLGEVYPQARNIPDKYEVIQGLLRRTTTSNRPDIQLAIGLAGWLVRKIVPEGSEYTPNPGNVLFYARGVGGQAGAAISALDARKAANYIGRNLETIYEAYETRKRAPVPIELKEQAFSYKEAAELRSRFAADRVAVWREYISKYGNNDYAKGKLKSDMEKVKRVITAASKA